MWRCRQDAILWGEPVWILLYGLFSLFFWRCGQRVLSILYELDWLLLLLLLFFLLDKAAVQVNFGVGLFDLSFFYSW